MRNFIFLALFLCGELSFAQAARSIAAPSAPTGGQSCIQQYTVARSYCRRTGPVASCETMAIAEHESPPPQCKFDYVHEDPICAQETLRALQNCEQPSLSSPSTGGSSSARNQNRGRGVEAPGDPALPGSAPVPSARSTNSSASNPNAASRSQGGENSEGDGGTSSDASRAGDYSTQALETEVRSCNASSQEAYKCCNAPEQCGAQTNTSSFMAPPTNDPEGMKRYCEQMKYASLSGERSNDEAAGICSVKHFGCSRSCKESKDKWEGYISNCRQPQCDPAKVQQAIGIFRTKISECNGLEKNEKMLSAQAGSNYQNSREAQLCAQQSAIDPASAGQMADQASQALNNQNQGPDCSGEKASSPECLDCSKYPNSPLCGGGYQNQNNGFETGSVGGGAVSEAEGGSAEFGSFNVGAGTDGLPQFPQFGGYQPQAVSNPGVQNGGGGGIPNMGGAAGGGGFGGEQGSSAGGRGGYNTDVLGGERGGGGGGSVSANPAAVSGGGGFSGYGAGAGDEEFKNKYGMDLKAYLPGGAKDPKRVIANAPVGTGHPEIAPIGESMFKRISNKFSQMCKAKQFIGCE